MSLMPPSLKPPADAIELGAFARLLNMNLEGVAVDDDSQLRCVMTMPVAGHTQPFGALHGGASAALAEQAGSIAALIDHPTRRPVGVTLSIRHLAGVRTGRVAAYAHQLSVAGRRALYQIEIRQAASDLSHRGDLIALADLTVMFTS